MASGNVGAKATTPPSTEVAGDVSGSKGFGGGLNQPHQDDTPHGGGFSKAATERALPKVLEEKAQVSDFRVHAWVGARQFDSLRRTQCAKHVEFDSSMLPTFLLYRMGI